MPGFPPTTRAAACCVLPRYLIVFFFPFTASIFQIRRLPLRAHCTSHSAVNRHSWHSVLKYVSTKLLNHVLPGLRESPCYELHLQLPKVSCELLQVSWNAGVHMPYEQAEAFVVGSQLWQPLQLPAARGGKKSINKSEVEVCEGTQLYPGI